MTKIYIPFNMIVDTDFGALRLTEMVQKIDPYSINKLKSFLLQRENINPILEYGKLRNFDILESAYDVMMDKYYDSILSLSTMTDLMSFVINVHKLGFSNDLQITIVCDTEFEIKYLKSSLNVKYSIEICLNENIKLNDFDYIFIKYMDYSVADYLVNIENVGGKRIYVADYNFNTLYDSKNDIRIIDPEIHMELESSGNIVCLVSLYNKKK